MATPTLKISAGDSAQAKANEYNRLIDAGYSDSQIKAAADKQFGTQSTSDWNYLQNLAAKSATPPPPPPPSQNVPAFNVNASSTAEQKAEEYNRLLKEHTDAQIKAAADAKFGTQSAADWSYLQNLAQAIKTQGTPVGYKGEELDPSQSTLSPNFADYVYNMLARGEAAASQPYQEYTGQRFAGPSALQQQAFSGIASLADPAAYNEALRALTTASRGLEGLSYTPATFDAGLSAGQAAYTPTTFSTGLASPRATPLPKALPQFPENWSKFTPEQKINWFNENKVDVDTMRRFGVPTSDIVSMTQQGYKGIYPQELNLPEEFPTYSAEQKLDWFNRNQVSPMTLLKQGVSPEELKWMFGQGYWAQNELPKQQVQETLDPMPLLRPGVSPEELQRVFGQGTLDNIGATLPTPIAYQSPYIPTQTGTSSFGATPGWDAGAAAKAASVDLTLPTGWGTYNPQQKIDYFNTNKVTPDQLLKSGVAQGDIDWMAGQGYKGVAGFADGGIASVADYMSPYTGAVTDIAAREARRQADIGRQTEQARLAQAGAYGGSRQAIMEAERQRNLMTQIGDITNTGLQSAYDRALSQRQAEATLGLEAQKLGEQSRQFGANYGLQSSTLGLEAQKLGEQSRQFGANLGLGGLQAQTQAGQALSGLGTQQGQYGLNALNAMANAGATQQQLAQQPLDFGYQQWQQSMQYPYQQATFMQSLLGGLPLGAAPYQPESSTLGGIMQGLLTGMGVYNLAAGNTGTKP